MHVGSSVPNLTPVHPLLVCMRSFVVHQLAYQGVNPLYVLCTTLPPPGTSHVHRLSPWNSTYYAINNNDITMQSELL